MARIMVIYTGGTLGMKPSSLGLVPSEDGVAERVIRLAPSHVDCAFEALLPLMDSASATPAHWDRLARRLEALRADYDGFVVLHGTDTLAWTAAALAFMLRGFGKPIVVTGAMRPFSIVGSDAPDNVADALLAATFMHLTEVTVAFGRKLWRGCRVRKAESFALDALRAPEWQPLAEFSPELKWFADRWRITPPAFTPHTLLPSLRVATLSLAPGATVALIADALERQKLDGVVLLTYGSGNPPQDPRLIRAVTTACERGTLMVNVSQAWLGEVDPSGYAGASVLTAAGVLPSGRLTPEAALAKLYVILSLGWTMEQQQFEWYSDWVGEMA